MTSVAATLEYADYALRPLREGPDFALYRGEERHSQNRVLGVTLVAEPKSPQGMERLECEFSLAAELDPEWAARPIALTHHQDRAILILEDPGGEPLDGIIERHQGRPIDMSRFLRIAIGLAAAIGQAHQQGLIHKDIKPANALVDDAGRAWLTGFGFASKLPRERQSFTPPEFIAGTLAYMAPEQTGRINRSIDSRSDLYSLGVTLYEMSTGRLPFTASEPMEWVHCQIARQPPSPREHVPGMPIAVSAIISKLLAKAAEERFQTAVGLQFDLQKCLEAWETDREVDAFPLGEYDTPDRLVIPEKLYGRATEIKALLASFNRVVAGGKSELILVSGYSGVGKSSVVNELQRLLVSSRAFFASGKFDQYRREIPYATVTQAFRSLILQILSKSEADLRVWQQSIDEALGVNGLLIVDLIPELELIVGKQPALAELSAQDSQRRFHAVLRRFIGVFTRAEHRITLFLDDLQWVDAATLDLLEELLTHGDVGNLLLIGAYRDNEVEAGHRLLSKLEKIRKAGASVHDIELTPLSDHDLEQFIGDALHCDAEQARPLTELVKEKTGGNPFFAIQFLHALDNEALLVFDHTQSKWSWNLQRIREKGYSDNVVDLMIAILKRLPAATSAALCQLSCLGSGATFALLASVCAAAPEKLHDSLRDAIRAGLLSRSADIYSFQHDRIQEAAYSLIPHEERAGIHLRIGRLLLTLTADEERDAIVFDILSQFDRGMSLVSSPDERLQLAQLNLAAGVRAKNAAAYAAALSYFSNGRALLADDGWALQHSLTFEFELHRSECEFLTGDLKSAENSLSVLATHAANVIDQAAVACLRTDLYVILALPERAIAVGLAFLRAVGFQVSPQPSDAEVQQAFERLWQLLGTRQIEELIDLPSMSNPERCATINVLNRLVVPALYENPKLHRLLVVHMVSFSMEHGNSAASCVGYVTLGRVLVTEFGDHKAALRFGQLSLDLVDKRGLTAFAARVYFSFGTGISSEVQHLRLGLPFLLRALSEAKKVGDLPYIGYCHSNIVGNMLSSGAPLLDTDRAAMDGLHFAHQTGSRIAAAYIIGQLRLIRSLRGLPCNFIAFDDQVFDADNFEQDLSSGTHLAPTADMYWSRRTQALVYEGNHEDAVRASARPLKHAGAPWPNVERAEYHFYCALARMGSVRTIDPTSIDRQIEYREDLGSQLRQLQALGNQCPENFESRAALVGAEIARLEGRMLEAEQLYAQAIRTARASGFVHIEALARETAARYYASRGFEEIVDMHLAKARDGYRRWGAEAKVRQLAARHSTAGSLTSHDGSTAMRWPDQQFDVAAIVKASQALSSEMHLPRLIERLMNIALEHAGAERGSLILVRSGESWIAADAVAGTDKIEVAARRLAITSAEVPRSVLNFAMRTRRRVLLDDAMADKVYADDEYVRSRHARSILCLPIIKQTNLIGALYLENNLTPGVFTASRVAVLELIASQAAISLENAALYTDLQRSEAFLAQGQKISHTGSFGWSVASGEFYWSEELYDILDYDRSVTVSVDLALERMIVDDRDRTRQLLADAMKEGKNFDSEHRLLMPDGKIKHVHTIGRSVDTGSLDFVGAVRDVTERVRTEETLRQAQADLAYVARVVTLNAMTASIAHEVSQPLAGILTNANTCVRMLAAEPPNLEGAAETAQRMIRDANRATDVIRRLRAMFSRQQSSLDKVDFNDAVREVIALSSGELQRHRAILQTNFAEGLPLVRADRVQVQQVILNLLLNAAEAMVGVEDRQRIIIVHTELNVGGNIQVDIKDCGIGVDPTAIKKLFDPFYTTKANGLGVGLSICRSIVESHHGDLWAVANDGPGATFSFYIPFGSDDSTSSL